MRWTIVLVVLGALVAPAAAQEGDGSGSGSDDDSGLGLPPDDDTTTPPSDDTTTPPTDDTTTPATPDPAMAKKLAEGAAKFEKKGDKLKRHKKVAEANVEYERALTAYDRAYEMAPTAASLLATAGLAAKLGHWADAAQRYQRAINETSAPLDAKAKAKAQSSLDQVMMQLGVITLTIVPDGASVAVDGADAGTTPLAQPLWLAPGDHTLALHADGYVDFETKLAVEAGSESERSFELKPVPVIVEKPRPPPEPPPPPPPLPPEPNKLPLYGGLGAAVVFAGIATTTGVMAISRHSVFTDPSSTDAQRSAAQSSGRTLAHVTDGFGALAIVAAGATAYYYFEIYQPKASKRSTEERSREGSRDELGWVVVPSAGRGEGGLVLAAWF